MKILLKYLQYKSIVYIKSFIDYEENRTMNIATYRGLEDKLIKMLFQCYIKSDLYQKRYIYMFLAKWERMLTAVVKEYTMVGVTFSHLNLPWN